VTVRSLSVSSKEWLAQTMDHSCTKSIVAVILAVSCAVAAQQCPAQEARFELGQRVKVVANGGDYLGKARPGEFWITLADEHGSLPVRIMAPDAAKGKPLPLVISLHGAGGSENMFFDAYGNGKIVDLCRKRGWLLVAPRLSFFGLGMPVDSIVAEIGQLYPVDKRQIFVVGHSMGAPRPSTSCNRLAIPLRLSLL